MLLPLPRTADFAWANRSPSLNLLITHYKFNPSTPFIIRFINFRISPHSLRSGVATDAAALQLPESVIKRMGRWKSEAYKVYVRPTALQQATLSERLASGHVSSSTPCTRTRIL